VLSLANKYISVLHCWQKYFRFQTPPRDLAFSYISTVFFTDYFAGTNTAAKDVHHAWIFQPLVCSLCYIQCRNTSNSLTHTWSAFVCARTLSHEHI